MHPVIQRAPVSPIQLMDVFQPETKMVAIYRKTVKLLNYGYLMFPVAVIIFRDVDLTHYGPSH